MQAKLITNEIRETRRQIRWLLTRTNGLEQALFNSRRRLGELLDEYICDGGDVSKMDIPDDVLQLLLAAGKAKRS